MKFIWIKRALGGALLVAVLIAALSAVVMNLWNWLLPALFGWPSLSLLQALGLLVLCRILFGGLRGGRHGHWREKMRDRWMQMSPEEREQLRAGLRGRCAPWHSRPEQE